MANKSKEKMSEKENSGSFEIIPYPVTLFYFEMLNYF